MCSTGNGPGCFNPAAWPFVITTVGVTDLAQPIPNNPKASPSPAEWEAPALTGLARQGNVLNPALKHRLHRAPASSPATAGSFWAATPDPLVMVADLAVMYGG
ncbi:hypothetical protein [Gloeomargarita sp.]